VGPGTCRLLLEESWEVLGGSAMRNLASFSRRAEWLVLRGFLECGKSAEKARRLLIESIKKCELYELRALLDLITPYTILNLFIEQACMVC
jgi:hypothetical protein